MTDTEAKFDAEVYFGTSFEMDEYLGIHELAISPLGHLHVRRNGIDLAIYREWLKVRTWNTEGNDRA